MPHYGESFTKMATSLVFTDSGGAATLVNGKPVPGDRFSNWVTETRPIGSTAARQSDGAISMFVVRTEYGASFELAAIPSLKVAGVAQSDLADRLIAWLMQGGTCTVNTGDADANVYTSVGLKPGSTPSLRLTDRQMMEYTLSLSVIALGASSAMLCRYSS